MKKIIILFVLAQICVLTTAQTADEIIQKHIERIGGGKAWNEVKSIKMNATLNSQQGGGFSLEHINTRDGHLYAAMDMQGRKFVQIAFDGKTAWGTNPETGQAEKRNEEITENIKRKAEEFPSPFINYKEKGFKVELLGSELIEGIDCYKIKLTKGKVLVNGEDIDNIYTSFISKKDYLEVASEEVSYQNLDKLTTNVIYSDFREVNGLTLPFCKNISSSSGFIFVILVESIEINSEVDYSVFEFKE